MTIRMSAALLGASSLDSSSSFVEIDSDNTTSRSSSHETIENGSMLQISSEGVAGEADDLDTKPAVQDLMFQSEHFIKNNFAAIGGSLGIHHQKNIGFSASLNGYHSHHHHQFQHAHIISGGNNSGSFGVSSQIGSSRFSSDKNLGERINNPSFMLPAQLYKSLFASAVMQNPDITPSGFARNLLFSCSEKSSPDSDGEIDEKVSLMDEKAAVAAFAWNGESGLNTNPSTSVVTMHNHHINNNNTNHNNNHQHNQNSNTLTNSSNQIQHQVLSTPSTPIPGNSPSSAISSSAAVDATPKTCSSAISAVSTSSHLPTMPVSGVQSQNPTQGLVHWMSAVMAEHMTSNSHHDPTVGMHYMWNGGVDQCGQHNKEMEYGGWPSSRNHMVMKQGYEAKMNEHHHHNNLHKGSVLDDTRIDHVNHQGQMAIYSSTSGPVRSGSSNSSSPGGHQTGTGGGVVGVNPGTPAALLVVPQPINATKIVGGMSNGSGTGRKYQCKMCPQIFSSKADLQLHTQIHMREAKPYKCSQCSKAFANSSYLSQHTRIHLGIKPYRCEICQRKFTQLSHLQQHIRTHTGDKPYKCRHPGCQKAFSQLSNLQSHSRCHQTDKPYKCNSCYKCFSDEPSLLEHIPKHKESKHLKTHICQYCGKSYTQETYLSKHMQKHAERTDKRPPISIGLQSNVVAVGLTNRNLGTLSQPIIANGVTDHPYWPKVSPDSAASLSEAMHQQHQQQNQHHQQQHQPHVNSISSHHDFVLPSTHQNNSHIDNLHQSHHHRMLENHGRCAVGDEVGEDLVISRQNSSNSLIPPALPPPLPSAAPNYDNITKTSSNSAFTPINSMTPHLNSLGHHHMAQRPYLYDAISFQNKQVQQNTANNFPNQLISLHQIRNYAHQPSGLMSSEHMLGVSVGKDKG